MTCSFLSAEMNTWNAVMPPVICRQASEEEVNLWLVEDNLVMWKILSKRSKLPRQLLLVIDLGVEVAAVHVHTSTDQEI